jgi:hypothetical protein
VQKYSFEHGWWGLGRGGPVGVLATRSRNLLFCANRVLLYGARWPDRWGGAWSAQGMGRCAQHREGFLLRLQPEDAVGGQQELPAARGHSLASEQVAPGRGGQQSDHGLEIQPLGLVGHIVETEDAVRVVALAAASAGSVAGRCGAQQSKDGRV